MDLREKIESLPDKSGVYIMRDLSGEIIYIGKAVVLKNRVRQYFNNSPKLPKVQAMVDNIADFEYIITLTEKDALSLESNLIKKYKPRYNILLKDDKSSPYIKIDMRQAYPAIEVTRKLKRDGSKYFGPYFNGIYVWDVVDIIRSAYRMRACPKKLQKSGRECLNYHIKLCLAPCCNRVSSDDYAEVVSKVVAFLSGREDSAQRLITQKMEDAVGSEEFERAIIYRGQLDTLKKLKERTVANLGAVIDLDTFYYKTDGHYSAIAVCIVRGGKMMGVRNYSVTDSSIDMGGTLTSFISQYYGGNNEIPPEISLQTEFDYSALKEYLSSLSGRAVNVYCPKAGSRKMLLTTAEENADDYLIKSVTKQKREHDMTVKASELLADMLKLKSVKRMECYDISNVSGVDKVASQAVFIDGSPSKTDYRRYKIKTVEGANDFASMAEVIKRRFERFNSGDDKFAALPNLIVIDGGKGQLKYAYDAMRAQNVDIPMISLAERDEEIYTLYDDNPIRLPKSSHILMLLQRIRDEAHRFAVTYYRSLHGKRMGSELEKIKGVGKAKRIKLLAAFENFNDLMTADESELMKYVDRAAAKNIYEYFMAKRSGQ